jgi:hypothetical protein
LKTFQTVLACLALAGAGLAQSKSSDPSLTPRPASPATSETASVAPDAAVITIQGICEKSGSTGPAADCKTVVTRAEFENLVNALQPNMPIAAQKQFANRYGAILYFAEKAKERGLGKGQVFEERLRYVQLEVLASLASEQMQKEATDVTDAEIEAYHHEHISDYKTISYERLYVPKQKKLEPPAQGANDPDLQKKREASEADMKAEADKLRARASAGEDFAKLQQEAYDFGGYTQIKSSNPRVDKVRKGAIPPADASIFELKTGDVSQVFAGPSGFVVYKIEAVEDVPVASLHDEISRTLANERGRRAMEALQNSTKLDDAYFAPPATMPTPAPPTLRNPGEAAPAPASASPTPAPGKK